MEKIYSKIENEILVTLRATGQKMKTLKLDFKFDNLLVDTNRDRIIVHTAHKNELEMFDETGTSLIKNQLKLKGVRSFEECHLGDCEYFYFINNNLNYMVVI